MARKKDTMQITFRASREVVRQLDEICAMSGIKRSEFIVNAIVSRYDEINGNPHLKKMLEKMKEIVETMKQINGQASGSGVAAITGAGAGGGGGGET
jgi:predicted nucleotide-binding protein (sugar kinase/HSP70/actin superfamily)